MVQPALNNFRKRPLSQRERLERVERLIEAMAKHTLGTDAVIYSLIHDNNSLDAKIDASFKEIMAHLGAPSDVESFNERMGYLEPTQENGTLV